MADYAGAVAAIQSRFDDAWTDTEVLGQNEQEPATWPPVNASGYPLPWVSLEVECSSAPIAGTGRAGDRTYTYEGTIMVHVFVPIGIGTAKLLELAVAAGEIFRRAQFYDATPGHCVRTEDPAPVGDPARSDDGNWYGITTAIDFVYWHRG